MHQKYAHMHNKESEKIIYYTFFDNKNGDAIPFFE